MTPFVENRIFDLNKEDSFGKLRFYFERAFSFLHISHVHVSGETILKSSCNGVRIFFLYRGKGAVHLPAGYRTKEGDGMPLPTDLYRSDPSDENFVRLLMKIEDGLANVSETAENPVRAILGRWSPSQDRFCGDISGELWRLLEQAHRPWSEDPAVESALENLFHHYREQGFSTKTTDSWEDVMVGDQLIATADEPLRVQGEFSCFSLEYVDRKSSHISAVRRLRYLLDTAGGCSPGFDPFRRLPTTWYPNYPHENGDGVNFFNNHAVNIPAENSPTHFHPKKPVGGGMPQWEFYLVLDPAEYELSTAGEEPKLTLFPDLADLASYQTIGLRPGMFVCMPPGTGHRGQNVFASILTLPGFKPGNELYLDRDIFERTQGRSPYNENHLTSKNYDNLDEYTC